MTIKRFGGKKGFLKNGTAYDWNVSVETPHVCMEATFGNAKVGQNGLMTEIFEYGSTNYVTTKDEIAAADQLVEQLIAFRDALEAAYEYYEEISNQEKEKALREKNTASVVKAVEKTVKADK